MYHNVALQNKGRGVQSDTKDDIQQHATQCCQILQWSDIVQHSICSVSVPIQFALHNNQRTQQLARGSDVSWLALANC